MAHLDRLNERLIDVLLKNPSLQPINDLNSLQQKISYKPNFENLFHIEPSPLISRIVFERDLETGELSEFKETFIDDNENNNNQNELNKDKNLFANGIDEDARTSMSLQRKALSYSKDIIQKTLYTLPFQPASVDYLCEREKLLNEINVHNEVIEKEEEEGMVSAAVDHLVDDEKIELKSNLIDFSNFSKNLPFMMFNEDEVKISNEMNDLLTLTNEKEQQLIDEILNFTDDQFDDESIKVKNDEDAKKIVNTPSPTSSSTSVNDNEEEEEESSETNENETGDDLFSIPVLNLTEKNERQLTSTRWAKVINCAETVNDFNEQIPYPAFKYEFELDTFQKQAIICLERSENVFVAAHTSAGKTVVAEYAIAMSIRRNLSRVIYTSPIKALSNQKFRDFRLTFTKKDIGLLTGDVQINTDASCLIMTTEILLHMLYNGSEIIRDIEWVIFDEVHYINDKERGHVWEEVLIMLPEHVNIVLLSATVANVIEFADWIGSTRKKFINVIYTSKRPVPLEHHLYTGSNAKTMNECFMFINSESKYLELGYRQAMETKKSHETKYDRSYGAVKRTFVDPRTELGIYTTLIRYLQKEQKLPVIVFTFSRKRCYTNARTLSEAITLTTGAEKSKIHRIIRKSVNKLKKMDQKIPQIRELSEILKKGFGIHHSGILPLLKEVTEILFSQGLVKVLFATETFAMGINMPARSVVFDTIVKHDGLEQRDLLSSEYIQMAGRAGRRGKDLTGTVIILCKNDVPESSILYRMSMGKATPLESKFRLTYSMILSILRSSYLRVESVLEKSFSEHEQQKSSENVKLEQTNIRKQLKKFRLTNCDHNLCELEELENFFIDYNNYCTMKSKVIIELCVKAMSLKKLSIFKEGRLLIYDATFGNNKNDNNSVDGGGESNDLFSFGVILKVNQPTSMHNANETEIQVLKFNLNDLIKNNLKWKNLNLKFDTIKLSSIHLLFKQIIKISGLNILKERTMSINKRNETEMCFEYIGEYLSELKLNKTTLTVDDLFNKFKSFDWLNDINGKKFIDSDFYESLKKFLHYRDRFLLNKNLLTCKNFTKHYQEIESKITLERNLANLIKQLSIENLIFSNDYYERLAVLRKLNYINDEKRLEMKGKIACLMSEHELVITELLIENIFGDMEPYEVAAIMSAFTFQEKVKYEMNLTDKLRLKISQVREIALMVGKTQRDCGFREAPDDVADQLKFGLVEVVYEWGKGMPFAQVMDLTEVQEGIIVRCIQRLDELLKDVKDAAKMFGDENLARKCDESSKCIRRDIVFAASLYIQDDNNNLNECVEEKDDDDDDDEQDDNENDSQDDISKDKTSKEENEDKLNDDK